MKGSDVIIKTLELSGIDTIFGYPGASILDIYDSLRRSDITHVLTAGENGAINAADGYARASGKLGAVIATSGPGASNLVTGLAAANLDGTPLIAITGNVPSSSLGTDSFQEVDASGLATPITKYSRIVKTPSALKDTLAEAITLAYSGRKGAVLVDVTQDVQQADIDIDECGIKACLNSHLNTYKNSDVLSSDAVRAIALAAEIISRSRKPVILTGGGVRLAKAETLATKFAKKLNCPVVTTLMGVSLYDNAEESYFGLTGSYGNPTANHALKTADAIISLGVRFNDRLRATGNLEDKKIIQLDIDDAENGKTVDAVCYIKGDLKTTLPALTAAVSAADGEFIRILAAHRRKVGRGDNDRRARNAFAAIGAYLKPCDVVATDVGAHQMSLAKNYCLKGTFLTNGGLGAMGWGLGAAIGALLTRRKSNRDAIGVLITGDGSFNMEMQELSTAVSLKLPLVIIIFNNNSLEMCRSVQLERFGYEYMARPAAKIDYVKLSESMGAKACLVKSAAQLRRALENFDRAAPLVVDFETEAYTKRK